MDGKNNRYPIRNSCLMQGQMMISMIPDDDCDEEDKTRTQGRKEGGKYNDRKKRNRQEGE